MITFQDVSGRSFTIIDCTICKEYDHGDILPIDEAKKFILAYPPPHLCFACQEAIEQEVSALVAIIQTNH